MQPLDHGARGRGLGQGDGDANRREQSAGGQVLMKARKMCCLARTRSPNIFLQPHVITFCTLSQVRTSV